MVCSVSIAMAVLKCLIVLSLHPCHSCRMLCVVSCKCPLLCLSLPGLLLQPILPVLPLTFIQIFVPQAFSSCFYLSRLAFNNWQNLHDNSLGKAPCFVLWEKSHFKVCWSVILQMLWRCTVVCKRGFSASWWDKGDLWETFSTRLSLVSN